MSLGSMGELGQFRPYAYDEAPRNTYKQGLSGLGAYDVVGGLSIFDPRLYPEMDLSLIQSDPYRSKQELAYFQMFGMTTPTGQPASSKPAYSAMDLGTSFVDWLKENYIYVGLGVVGGMLLLRGGSRGRR